MGPPPLVGVAVKITLVPAQIGPAGLASMVTDGTTLLATVITTSLVDAGQGAFEMVQRRV